jgi:di/tricarboxylate transporter
MTLDQGLAFGIIIIMMVLFAWGRWRYDLVAVLTLVASVVAGIVPAEQAFKGFSDDIVIIVGSALVVSAAVGRSGAIERVVRWLGPYLHTVRRQVIALVGSVALLSAFIKNVAALAMLIPIAFQLARRTNTSPSSLLMPMSFGALLGGIVTLVGTSPNIIVSQLREQISGQPFGMFDFAPVGAGIAIAGFIFLIFGWRLIPRGRKGAASIDEAFRLEGYTTEVRVPEDSPAAGATVRALEELGEEEIAVITLFRGGDQLYEPADNTVIKAGDILILQGEPAALERVVALDKLELAREDKGHRIDTPSDQIGVTEAVIMPDSELVGNSIAEFRLFDRHAINLLAVSRKGQAITHRLRQVKLRAGDVIILRGNLVAMPASLGELHCLPLAERDLRIGRKTSLVPILVLAVAVILVAGNMVPVSFAFFGASVALVLIGSLSLRDAYEAIDWPILIMLGALIPVSDALRTTGGTELIATGLSHTASSLPAMGSLALLLAAAMAVTPFLNNAATVLVMAPIAASFAERLSYNADPFLMAVAIGAACDFLTPIGHQCNTLVMGPGGYGFADYWRLGLPLSLIVLATGVPLIAFFWPI